jgi:hypothetical protein
MTINVGDTVETIRMSGDSFYKHVRGTVTAIRNGWASIDATQVIDKWSTDWAAHPTSCATSAKLDNIVQYTAK